MVAIAWHLSLINIDTRQDENIKDQSALMLQVVAIYHMAPQDNTFMNFSNALYIIKTLASKVLVLHHLPCIQLWIFQGSVEELPAITKWNAFL